jgi:hypothetical protein
MRTSKESLLYTLLLLAVPASSGGQASPQSAAVFIGPGCTTATMIDSDCDGYGPGSPLGPDADDTDPTVHTADQMLAKWGTLANFLSAVKGYQPKHIWYISPSGNDSNCSVNDDTKPCQSFAVAYSKSSAGDAIVARAGTYLANHNYSIGRSGTSAAHPDIIMAYPGEAAIFDHGTAGWYGFSADLAPVNYTIFDGLIIKNTPQSSPTHEVAGMGIDLNAAGKIYGDVIRNCEIRDYYRGIWIIAGSQNLLIENNVIHDNYGGSSGEHNIYLGQNSGSGGHAVNVVVRNNILYNANWDNFHFNGVCDNCSLSGNIMHSANMAQNGGSANIALQQGWDQGLIENNIIFNSSAYGVLINDYDDSQPIIKPYNQNYNTIRNNTFVHTGRDASGQDLSGNYFTTVAIINNSGQTSPPLDLGHNTYDNNIFVEAAVGGGAANAIVRYQRNQAGDPNWIATDTWRNNLLYASNGAAPLSIGIGNIPPDQSWAYFSSQAAVFAGNSQAAPMFIAMDPSWYNAPRRFNLRVQAGSPAIGAGMAADASATDITGNPRSGNPDIGAYQSGGGDPPRLQLPPTVGSPTVPRGSAPL